MGQPRSGYEDVERIEDPDGIVAVISRRRSNGHLTLALFKTYRRDDAIERTSFFGSEFVPAAHRVLDLASRRMEKLREEWEARTQVDKR
jgi:hypothetical protein